MTEMAKLFNPYLKSKSPKFSWVKDWPQLQTSTRRSLGGMSKLISKGYISSVSNAVSTMLSLNSKENSTMDRLGKIEEEIKELELQREDPSSRTVSLLYFSKMRTSSVFDLAHKIWLRKKFFTLVRFPRRWTLPMEIKLQHSELQKQKPEKFAASRKF